jgi:mRNA degradation ribonuclease J1/J2
MSTCTELPPEPAAALTTSPLGQLRRLTVHADDTQVVITGRVSSYYLKQMAQETVRPALRQRVLLNRVEVCPDAA